MDPLKSSTPLIDEEGVQKTFNQIKAVWLIDRSGDYYVLG